jgi:hypothetical protein
LFARVLDERQLQRSVSIICSTISALGVATPTPIILYEYHSKRVTGIDRPMNVILKDLRAIASSDGI